ncbi:hypothetical protein Fmac_008450 [Flemingia macrophylla]|uniref:Uncharacterized protein n=1 Tax=Flemingia macrophylla TaxID=520843 RepID=A0ABD1MXG2_9FABA
MPEKRLGAVRQILRLFQYLNLVVAKGLCYSTSSALFGRTRSEAASCGGGEEISPLDPIEEEKLRNKSWLVAVGGKNPEG